MRSIKLFGPIATDVGVTQVIGQHEDNVREFRIRNLGAYSFVIRRAHLWATDHAKERCHKNYQ